MTDRAEVAAVILAGGQARRMGGGDKCLLPLDGGTLLDAILARIAPQVGPIVLNANGDPARFARFGRPVAADSVAGQAGPLAGVLTGMEWAAANAPDCRWLLSLPGDGPFPPEDLVARFLEAIERDGGEMACAASAGRAHPVIGLWPVRLAADLRHALTVEEIRKVDRWTARYRLSTVAWEVAAIDPFFNVNTPEDLARAQEIARTRSPASHTEPDGAK